MRKHAKYFYVLFFIVILSFIFWGVGTVDKQGCVLGGGRKLQDNRRWLWKTYDRIYRFYREIYKDKLDKEAEKDEPQENVLN
jgi:peptidyl-prolyl cis-trans isomerase D